MDIAQFTKAKEFPRVLEDISSNMGNGGEKRREKKRKLSAKYDEEDFNELLNSSPKKDPRKNTHAKNRDWEQLEAMVTTEKKDIMGDFDDLIESQGEPSP